MKRIIFVSFDLEIGGAQLLLKTLAHRFNTYGFECEVWGPVAGKLVNELDLLKIPCHVKDFDVDWINRNKTIEFNSKTRLKITKLLDKCKKNQLKLVIRCAGTITEKLLNEFDFSGVNLVGIFDNNQALIGSKMKSFSVYSIDSLEEFEVDQILIAHLKPKFIKKELESKGHKNVSGLFDISKPEKIFKLASYFLGMFEPINFFMKIKPDIIFVNNANNFWAVIAGKLLGKKIIWNIHESFAPNTFRVFPQNLYFLSFKLADKFIFVSKATYNLYRNLIDPKKVSIIHGGIDVQKVEKAKNKNIARKTRLELNIPENFKVVCNIGTIEERKGQIYLVKSALNLLRSSENKNYVFILVGCRNDKYSNKIKELIKNSGFEENFRIIPVSKEAYKYLNISDIFVCSSITESFPLVILEAMAFEKPIISTDIHGIPEAITHNQTGILIPLENMEYHIEKNINYLFQNPEIMKNLAQNAHSKFMNNYTLDIMVENYKKVLLSLN